MYGMKHDNQIKSAANSGRRVLVRDEVALADMIISIIEQRLKLP